MLIDGCDGVYRARRATSESGSIIYFIDRSKDKHADIKWSIQTQSSLNLAIRSLMNISFLSVRCHVHVLTLFRILTVEKKSDINRKRQVEFASIQLLIVLVSPGCLGFDEN